MENKFYVYLYLDPRKPGEYTYQDYTFDFEPFYVGCGKNNRLNEHLTHVSLSCGNMLKNNKIKKIVKETTSNPIIVKYKENLTREESFNIEKELIKLIGRSDINKGSLTNLTDGGEGPTNCSTIIKYMKENNPMFNPESRAKISGDNNIMRKDPLVRLKMMESKKGKIPSHMIGETNPAKRPEVRELFSKLRKGKKLEDIIGKEASDKCKKIAGERFKGNTYGKALKGRKRPDVTERLLQDNPAKRPEVRQKISEAKKKNNAASRPEVRLKISLALKGRKRNVE